MMVEKRILIDRGTFASENHPSTSKGGIIPIPPADSRHFRPDVWSWERFPFRSGKTESVFACRIKIVQRKGEGVVGFGHPVEDHRRFVRIQRIARAEVEHGESGERADVFTQECTKGDYIHGYLLNSGFAESVRRWHKIYPEVPLHFFWDSQGENPITEIDETLSFHQLDDIDFLRRMAGCKAYASTAGFESVCEAMYLGKPILMVPAHIEQECNAYDAVRNGAGVADEDFNLERLLEFAETYRPNPDFVRWAQSAGCVILDELESFFPQNQLRHMFMVEEFV